jgi:nicotinamidase-related amidase
MNNGNNSIFVPDGKNAIHDGIEHDPGGGKALLDPTDTLFLLLDHQSGLFQNVKDISVAELRANTTALAKLATLQQIPVITTASVPDGPNGPLMPEIQEAAPHAVYVPRKGEVNAWDNALFVKTVRETGKKTLVIAGVWTSVCVMFPALDAKAAGFKVYAVMDASGDPSEFASRTTLARTLHAGWRDSYQRQCRHLRSASHLEPSRRRLTVVRDFTLRARGQLNAPHSQAGYKDASQPRALYVIACNTGGESI